MSNAVIDAVVGFLFFGMALVGVTLILLPLGAQRRTERRLAEQAGSEGVAIITHIHVRENYVRLFIFAVFLSFGPIQLIPHDRYDLVWWIGTLLALSIEGAMLWAILAGRRDARKALRQP